MRAKLLPLALAASCGFAHAHPRALTMTAVITASTGLAALPFVTDCTSQPGDHCARTALEAAGVGFAVGVLVAAIVGREMSTKLTPLTPPAEKPRWTPPADYTPLGEIKETPPPPTPPSPFAPHAITISFGEAPPEVARKGGEGVGRSAAEACAFAKQSLLDRMLAGCRAAGISAIAGVTTACSCDVTASDQAQCTTDGEATCATDEQRVAFGSGSSSSRTVAEARAIENARGRCGEFRQGADLAPATCAQDGDAWVCVALASCKKGSAARAVP